MTTTFDIPPLCVVGSINVDLTAIAERLPGPGETIGEAALHKQPGGKGANQAAAAARLGAHTRMVGAIGDDADGQWMLNALRNAGVDTVDVSTVKEAATGTALIVVDRDGENQIAVCPGANHALTVDKLSLGDNEIVLTQLEVPTKLIIQLASITPGYLAINTAPAHSLPAEVINRADLLIANEYEYQQLPELSKASLVAVTYGANGAALLSHGQTIAAAAAVPTRAVNTVGAGDAFSAAITLALAAGLDHHTALNTACAVGSAAVQDPSSQPEFRRLSSYAAQKRTVS